MKRYERIISVHGTAGVRMTIPREVYAVMGEPTKCVWIVDGEDVRLELGYDD